MIKESMLTKNNFKFNFHFVFISLIILYYSLPFILFDSFVFLSETDSLDSEIVYNKIIGQILLGNFYILDSLLDGEYKWFYFTRIFYFSNIFYSFFSSQTAFLILDIITKLFAYLSFFKLSKLINNKSFLSFILATTYSFVSTANVDDYYSSIFGFGSAIIPYLIYLTIKNKPLKIKNYIVIIFAALNSHFYFALNMLLLPIFIFFFNKNLNFKIVLKIFSFFIFFCILVHLNIIFVFIV